MGVTNTRKSRQDLMGRAVIEMGAKRRRTGRKDTHQNERANGRAMIVQIFQYGSVTSLSSSCYPMDDGVEERATRRDAVQVRCIT